MISTHYSETAANRAVAFFNKALVHTKGKWAGTPFNLRDWQENDIIRPLFGTLNPDGTRAYRTAYIEIPRKNGKSEIAAGVALKLLYDDGEEGGEIYSAAADRDQASLVFNVAAEMVDRHPALKKRSKIWHSTKRIIDLKSKSVYRAISAEAFSKHGLNASGIIFDEIHAQPTRELWDVLTTSTGAREQPLTFGITTAGYDRESICWELHEYARKLLDGVIEDETFFAYILAAGEQDDWTDEAVWRKCNPALGDFRSIEEMRQLARRAQETPSLQNTFRRLYLNQWTQQETRWLDIMRWDASAGFVDPEELRGRACYGGLDLASTTDIAAFVLVFPMEDGTYHVLPWFWIPGDNLRERGNRDRAPYETWVQQGLVTATPGAVIDYDTIEATIIELGERYNIREIAFDRWGATQISQALDGAGFTVIPFGQGFASMSAPTKELEKLVLEGRFTHGGNPVLRYMADAVVVVQDPAGNLKPAKHKSSARIDGIVASIMGLDRTLRNENAESVYEERGILAV